MSEPVIESWVVSLTFTRPNTVAAEQQFASLADDSDVIAKWRLAETPEDGVRVGAMPVGLTMCVDASNARDAVAAARLAIVTAVDGVERMVVVVEVMPEWMHEFADDAERLRLAAAEAAELVAHGAGQFVITGAPVTVEALAQTWAINEIRRILDESEFSEMEARVRGLDEP